MLTALGIRNVVLIEKLDLTFEEGLCVLTGETGAGKSILLDALGLALGERADTGLLRHDGGDAVVTATFEVAPDHPAIALAAEHGIDIEDVLILRRTLNAAGRTRAFINDQSTSVGFLRRVGGLLVEIQGQFAQQGLLDSASHLPMLDAFGQHGERAAKLGAAYRAWRDAVAALHKIQSETEQARQDEDYLRHALAELDQFGPEADEDAVLSEERRRLMQAGNLVDAVDAARRDVAGRNAVAESLGRALRRLERVAEAAQELFDPVIAALDRALDESEAALDALTVAGRAIEIDDSRLNTIEERLFALRDLARKHRVDTIALPEFRQRMRERLSRIDDQSDALAALEVEVADRRSAYVTQAESLSKLRAKASKALDAAVGRELPPLKLDNAVFVTQIERLGEDDWTPSGIDRVRFTVSTNPGTPAGPIERIASGGELSRFMLAIKVVLTTTGAQPSLVFDEIDSGVGGATAYAVGERLRRLAERLQVLVVTHSPQVAARGVVHLRVHKSAAGGQIVTGIHQLSASERQEEVARMLSGAAVTKEARAAARRLIEGNPQ
jgi:DNA repair protein RecN (Recombination protein N)